MVPFMQAQECIRKVEVVDGVLNDTSDPKMFVVRFDGIPKDRYEAFYDLSFHSFPNEVLPSFMARQEGFEWDGSLRYDCPKTPLKGDYMVINAKVDEWPEMFPIFDNLVQKSPYPVVVVGRKGQYIGGGLDLTGLDMLEMASVISGARAFVGNLSAPLTIAQGFPIPKVVVYQENQWASFHVLRDRLTRYLEMPTAKRILGELK